MKNHQWSSSSSSILFFITLAFSLSLSSSWPVFSNLNKNNELASSDDVDDFVTCIQSYSNDVSITQLVFTPSNSSFLPIWEFSVNNLRFNKSSTPKPCYIVTPTNEAQIQAAIYCTKSLEYEIRIRSGGHDFEGLSYTALVPFVMIDLINIRSIDIDVINKSAWLEAGATLGEFYYAISNQTDALYFPAGVCATVGAGGYLSGGGYGNLLRKYGTGADNVLDVRFIDVNGRILDRKSMGEDLFWALRGGGGSSFGVIVAWQVRLVDVPEKVTVFQMFKTLEEDATAIFYKYQFVAPTIDQNLHIRIQIQSQYIGNTTTKTIRMFFQGLYQGTIDTLLPLMDEKFPELGVTRENSEEMRMVQTTLVFEGNPSSTPTEILANRAEHLNLNMKGKSDYVREPISVTDLEKIWKKIFENDGSEFMMINPWGGRIAEYSETAIPYPHRAGVLYQWMEMVNFDDQTSDTTPISLRRIRWLKSFHKFITPYVSKNPREAYFNYNDLDLGVGSGSYEEASVWGESYWKRDNFKKLIRIKAKVDPDNFFRHTQSIPVFAKPFSDVEPSSDWEPHSEL